MFNQLYNNSGNLLFDLDTLYFYFCIVIISFILGELSQKSTLVCKINSTITLRPKHKVNYFWLFLFFFILILVSGLRDVGTDLPVYRNIFIDSNSKYSGDYQNEPGFILFNSIIRYFVDSANVAIFLFSFLSFYFIYKTIEYYSTSIDISIAFLALTTMFYFQGFNLLRIYLVAYFLCYKFKLLIEGKTLLYIIIVTFCIAFHYSSILMLLPCSFYVLYKYNKQLFKIGVFIFVIGLFCILPYLSVLNVFARYTSYLEESMSSNSPFGIAQLIYHLPIWLMIIFLKRRKYDSVCLDLLIVYSIFSFIYGCLGYVILMIGRVSIYFMVIYVILIPKLLHEMKIRRDKYYYKIKFAIIIYLMFRCHLYFKEYLFLDSIMPYKMIESL